MMLLNPELTLTVPQSTKSVRKKYDEGNANN
jgi:hypothetical protein